jgi:endonuclease YncB( thermonuclease family)
MLRRLNLSNLSFSLGIVLVLFLSGCTAISSLQPRALQLPQAQPDQTFELTGQAIRILDGDTFDLSSSIDHKVFRIRLKGIDAPEKTQPFGQEAKQYLTKLISTASLTVRHTHADKYGRTIGKVLIKNNRDDRDVCIEMIQAGYS